MRHQRARRPGPRRRPRHLAHPAGSALVLLTLTAALQSPAAAALPSDRGFGLAGDWPLDRARAAVATMSFAGMVEVLWTDRSGPHTERLTVRAAGGVLEVQGLTSAMSDSGGAQLLRRPDGTWDLLWSGSQAATGRPDASAKYQVVAATNSVAPTVAGRPSTVFEVRQGPALRERLFLDDGTGILLRREQLDTAGIPARVVGFASITFDPAMPEPTPPPAPANHVPRPVPVSAVAAAPAVLPGGYQRAAAYRETGAVQVLYSDGLYDMSVFEQYTNLAARDVPRSGTRVEVGRGHGWAYSWAGGQVLLWHAGHVLYTLVGDAPLDHLVTAAAALPAAGGAPSLVNRLRRACASIVEPLAA